MYKVGKGTRWLRVVRLCVSISPPGSDSGDLDVGERELGLVSSRVLNLWIARQGSARLDDTCKKAGCVTKK